MQREKRILEKGGQQLSLNCTTASSDWYQHNLTCLPFPNDTRAALEKGVCALKSQTEAQHLCIYEQFDLHRPST